MVSISFSRAICTTFRKSASLLGAAFLTLCVSSSVLAADQAKDAAAAPGKVYRIMAVGDSITEGGARHISISYRISLWEKLTAAGYRFEFVGARTSETPHGPLKHEGYSGRSAEFLAKNVPPVFKSQPADIVLIAAGHNHTAEEKPVGKIIAATEAMIGSFREINPDVTVLLAQVIPSGKLPKYAYIPELNEALAKLAARINTPKQPVILVDLATGFDWHTDAIADHVHPNAQGAEKMALRWFAALEKVMRKPAHQ